MAHMRFQVRDRTNNEVDDDGEVSISNIEIKNFEASGSLIIPSD
jgi:hypothetical protein